MFNLGIYRNRGSGGGLWEHQRTPAVLSDLLPWALFVGPGLILNKDGAFQKTIGFRGPDLASSTLEQLVAARGQLNNVLKRLGSSWCLHIEARRRPAPDYPQSQFPDEITGMIDAERRDAYRHREIAAFESDYFLTFTYLPPDEKIGRAEALVMKNAPKAQNDDIYRAEMARFEQAVLGVADIMSGFMPFVRALDDVETITYLHDCVSESHHRLAMPDTAFALDALLPDCHLVGGLQPMLGDSYVRAIGVNGFPGATVPGLLDALNGMPFGYRWVSRFLPLDKTDATKALTTLRVRWFSKRKGLGTLFREAITKEESALENTDALNKAAEANQALEVLGGDLVSFGYFTPVIVLMDRDFAAVEYQSRAVRQILDSQGLVSRVEDTNAVVAWLSTLPGHAYANCRRPLVSSANLADMIPLSAVWAGPAWNAHLNGPPLLMARTPGSTPFRLSLHQGDVGHTMIVGPTGAGKSVLLNFMAMQFRRYPGAQVFFFDKGGSAKATTHLVGGDFYPLGGGDGEAAFQPLAEIDVEEDRVWASEWIAGITLAQGISVSPARKEEIWAALSTLASRAVEQRTLTLFRSLVQDRELKAALQPFTTGGPYAEIFDRDNTDLGVRDWQTFEMERLYDAPPAIAPALGYLFHRLQKRFTGAPTMLVLDEAWLFLDDPQFASKIREWLKTLRRANVSVVFASQSLDDVAKSSIASALIENCLTRIFLPNDRASEPQTRALYESFGLSSRQIQIISQAIPKAQYYYQSRSGSRLFELGLSRLALAAVGSSTRNDLKEIDAILATHGQAGFAREFFARKGLNLTAEPKERAYA